MQAQALFRASTEGIYKMAQDSWCFFVWIARPHLANRQVGHEAYFNMWQERMRASKRVETLIAQGFLREPVEDIQTF